MSALTLSLFDAPATQNTDEEFAQALRDLLPSVPSNSTRISRAAQAALVEICPTAPSNRTETSKAAADHVLATGQAATQIAQVLSLIEQAGQEGTTRGDIASALGLPTSTICARVDTLRKAQRVQEDGRTRIPKCGGAVRQKIVVGVGI